MGFIQEFKEFAVRGNVLDLAVGVIIGASFNKIVSSLVADVIMPPVGMLVGGVDFTSLKLDLAPPIEGMQRATLNYGRFLQAVVDFLIVAMAVFLMVKAINTLKRRMEFSEPKLVTPPEVALLTEIRDLLRAQGASASPGSEGREPVRQPG